MQINKTTLRYMLKSFIFNGTFHLVKIRSASSAFSISEEVQQSYFAVILDQQSPSSCENKKINCDKISRYLPFHR